MAKYNVFESTNMRSTGRYSARIFDAVATTDIENGTFGYLDGLNEDGGVVYKFVAGTKEGLKAGDVVVADNPAWDADNGMITNQRKDKYIIPAGTVFRARVIEKNDEFATAIEGVTAGTRSVVTAVTNFVTTKVYVTIDASTGKLAATTTAPQSGIMVGQIMRKRISGGKLVTTAHTYGYATDLYVVKVTALA